MSQWYEPKKEDLDTQTIYGIDYVNIYLTSDYSGAIYAQVKMDDLVDVINDFVKKQNEENKTSTKNKSKEQDSIKDRTRQNIQPLHKTKR